MTGPSHTLKSAAAVLADFAARDGAADLDRAVGQMWEALDEDREVFERGASEIESEAPHTARLLRRFAELREEYKTTATARDRLAADAHREADEARAEEACVWMQRVVDPLRAALGHTSGAAIDLDATVDAACIAIRKARAPRSPAQSQTLLLTLRAACEWVGAERSEVFAEDVRESPLALVALLVDAIGKTQDSRGTPAARNVAEGDTVREETK